MWLSRPLIGGLVSGRTGACTDWLTRPSMLSLIGGRNYENVPVAQCATLTLLATSPTFLVIFFRRVTLLVHRGSVVSSSRKV